MITKIKSLSKRTLSVLLVLLMVVSTVTVGIITTTAAFIEKENEAVAMGADRYICIKIDGTENWISPEGSTTISLSSYSNGDKAYFDLYADEWDGGTRHYYNQGGGINATSGANYSYSEGGDLGSSRNWFNVSSYSSITVSPRWQGGATSVRLDVTGASGSTGAATYYIKGDPVGSWSNTAEMTASGSNYYYQIAGNGSEKYFRYLIGSTEYEGKSKNADISAYNSSSNYYTSQSGTGNAMCFSTKNNYNYRIWANNTHVWVEEIATNKTVTYDYATGSNDTMGTIAVTKKSGGSDVSIGASTATVANGEAVTFTATPVFGYHFVGWYTDAAATSLNTTINASANDGSNIGVISTNPAISVTSDITAYAKFAPNTSDGYYLSGRFATATNDANIHSNTTGKSGVDMYGTLTDDGDGLDEVTSSTNPSAYWTFNQYSTNLPFTSAGEGKYKLETHRTVKQLSEDKAKLQEEYGGSFDDYHGAFQFIVHDKIHRLVASDTAAAAAFHDKDAESKAIDLNSISSSDSLADSVEPRFNDFSSLSNGQVVIWLDVKDYDSSTGTGTPKLWYEIVDETDPVADSVALTASPSRVAKGNQVQLTAALSNANASAGTIYYDFYRSTSQNQQWEKISADNNTDSVLNYTENSSSGTVYYHVVARSGNTTTSSSGHGSMPFNVRSDSTSVDTYTAGVFVTKSNIKDLALDGTPTWSDDQKSNVTSGDIYNFGTSSITNTAPFVFTISSEKAWDPDYEKMDIDADSNQFCTIAYGTKEVNKVVNGETKTVMIRTYVVTPNPKCTNPTIYFDFKNNKVWAVAEVGTFTKEQTATLGDKGETVTYYFAERIGGSNNDDQQSNPTSNPRDNKGVKITYWNNSLDKNGYKDVTTPANGPTNDNIIYVKPDAFAHTGEGDHGYDMKGAYKEFRVYKVDLPIWATSFKFTTSNGGEFYAVPTGKDGSKSLLYNDVYSARTSKNHSITLNPNRIYCLFKGGEWRIGGVVLDDLFAVGMVRGDPVERVLERPVPRVAAGDRLHAVFGGDAPLRELGLVEHHDEVVPSQYS